MGNPIKYNTGSESLALKKGNFYIGTGDVGKGPTSTTGYYNGITPPSGGYTIYLNKGSGGPSIYTCSNDTELISLTNSIAGQSYTTANECLTYFAGQTDKICVNRDYEGIVTDGLVLNLDAGFTPSYPRNGTTWYDVGGINNGTLTNGPTYNSGSGGNIVFDGTNDYINCGNNSSISFGQNKSFTIEIFFETSNYSKNLSTLIARRSSDSSCSTDYMVFYEQGNKFTFGIGCSNNAGSWTNVSNFNVNNQIMCFTGVVSSTGAQTGVKKMYKNGVQLNSLNYIYKASSTTNNTYIGKYNGNGAYFEGTIYTTKIYDRALSADEVLQNYNAQKGRFGL